MWQRCMTVSKKQSFICEKGKENYMSDTEKKAGKPAKSDNKPAKKSFFQGIKHEFKQIKWPGRDDIVKESAAVLIVSVILGIVISLVDLGFKFGIDKLLGIGG